MSYSHAHYFGARTFTNLGHSHFIEFFTFPANGTSTDGHSHDFTGVTKYSEKPIRHFHRYQGVTGAAIPLPDGTHYHEVRDEVNDEPFQLQPSGGGMYKTVLEIKRHTHSFSGLTGTEIGKPPHGW